VVLLSHICIQAPRMFFDKILTNDHIMDKYAENFIFIHSYFERSPTIVCSKEFVKSMVSPNMRVPSIQNKYIYTAEPVSNDIEEIKDCVLEDKIRQHYDCMSDSMARSLKLDADTTMYRYLFTVTAQDIIPLLGFNEDHFCSNDSDIQ